MSNGSINFINVKKKYIYIYIYILLLFHMSGRVKNTFLIEYFSSFARYVTSDADNTNKPQEAAASV